MKKIFTILLFLVSTPTLHADQTQSATINEEFLINSSTESSNSVTTNAHEAETKINSSQTNSNNQGILNSGTQLEDVSSSNTQSGSSSSSFSISGEDNTINSTNTHTQETFINQGSYNDGVINSGNLSDDVNVEQQVNIHQHSPEETFEFQVDANETKKFLYVDPRTLARDYEEAFQAIIELDPDAKVYIVVKGRSIDRITDLKVMNNKTLVLITYKIGRKYKQRAIKPEDIEELGQR